MPLLELNGIAKHFGAIEALKGVERLPKGWLEGLKLHAATLPLAEFAAVVGNLRAARFGRDSAWRTTAHARRARRDAPHADPARC